MPGPKDADAETLPHFMKDYVDDLIMLWKHGVVVKTPKYPHGAYPAVLLLSPSTDDLVLL